MDTSKSEVHQGKPRDVTPDSSIPLREFVNWKCVKAFRSTHFNNALFGMLSKMASEVVKSRAPVKSVSWI
jgi:hypothetical protein